MHKQIVLKMICKTVKFTITCDNWVNVVDRVSSGGHTHGVIFTFGSYAILGK